MINLFVRQVPHGFPLHIHNAYSNMHGFNILYLNFNVKCIFVTMYLIIQ